MPRTTPEIMKYEIINSPESRDLKRARIDSAAARRRPVADAMDTQWTLGQRSTWLAGR